MTETLKQLIEKSERIILQCHKNPDPDSVGSALAWNEILTGLGKEVEIICPNKLSDGIKQLFPNANELVQQSINFQNFDYSKFDLFLINDTASISQLANTKDFELPTDVEIFVIDHHKSNDLEAKNTIVKGDTFANAQVLYKIFNNLQYEITPSIATNLYAGMLTDTYNFLYADLDSNFFTCLANIISKHADTQFVINTLHKSNSLNEINAMGFILNKIEIAGKNKRFAWVYVDHAEMEQFNISYHDLKDKLADEIINTIEGTDFGIVIYKLSADAEEFYLSIRARSDDFDSAKLAEKFNGGGHKSRAGGSVKVINSSKVLKLIIDALT